MSNRRASLRVELVAVLAVVLAMAVVSLSLTTEWLGQRRHGQREFERLHSHARAVAVLAARSFRGGDFERAALEELLRDSAAQLGTASYELHRQRAEGGFEQIASVGVHAGFDGLPAPGAGGRDGLDDQLLARWNLIVVDVAVPAAEGGLVLRLIAEHSPWTRGSAWRETLLVAGGVGLVLLVLGGLLLEIQVLRPMRALEYTVAAVGSGQLDSEAPTDGPKELGQLAAAFNRMTASLRGQQRTLASQREDLQRAEQLATLGRLSAGIAHEVGNPLAAIVGYAELLRDEDGLSPEGRDVVARIQRQAERIQGIVAQLLDYSRPAREQLETLDLGPRIAELLALLRADPRGAGVEVELIDTGELAAVADGSLVDQIVLNLLLNAAGAAARGQPPPRVCARLHRVDERACIDIEDSGPGVDAALREQLFEPFFTTEPAGAGTGLGLAISRGLAERMAASLTCLEARSELGGAVFRVSLPPAEPGSGPGSGPGHQSEPADRSDRDSARS